MDANPLQSFGADLVFGKLSTQRTRFHVILRPAALCGRQDLCTLSAAPLLPAQCIDPEPPKSAAQDDEGRRPMEHPNLRFGINV